MYTLYETIEGKIGHLPKDIFLKKNCSNSKHLKDGKIFLCTKEECGEVLWTDVCVPPNSYVGMLTSNMLILGVGTMGDRSWR
jgi:hypothetical protein